MNILFSYVHDFGEELPSAHKTTYDTTLSREGAELLNRQTLDWLTGRTGRSINQTKFLFNILRSWKLLLELEESIRTFQCRYCPGSLEECFYLIGRLRTWKSCGWLEKRSEHTLL